MKDNTEPKASEFRDALVASLKELQIDTMAVSIIRNHGGEK